jgi:hypothetical protein
VSRSTAGSCTVSMSVSGAGGTRTGRWTVNFV